MGIKMSKERIQSWGVRFLTKYGNDLGETAGMKCCLGNQTRNMCPQWFNCHRKKERKDLALIEHAVKGGGRNFCANINFC